MSRVKLSRLAVPAAFFAAAACVSPAPRTSSFATPFDLPDSDTILVDWAKCPETKPCIRGSWEEATYSLGFHNSPGILAGLLGSQKIQLKLDADSIYSYGNQVLEMTFADAQRRTVVAVTWNERDQKLIDAQLVIDSD